ncbi:MAG: protein kinase [Polyangiaceae bacterium]
MLEFGQIIEGKYRIARLIGEGGMGSVYEGENTLIRRRVAIKVLHAHSVSPETVMRFEREAQAAGCIGSDHILEVLDLGSLPNGDRFMVMEFLDGETLGARMSKGRIDPVQVVSIMRQVLVGLQAAHAASIIHRDLKPDNIFILREKAGRPDFAKIIDFGISKFNALGGDMSMTRTGAVMGTPYYMSPEQAQGTQGIDGRSDVYSLGVIMYEALAGAVPFDGDTFNELMFKIVLSNPRPLQQMAPHLDPQLVGLVEQAMSRSLDGRFQSAEQMIQAIDSQFGPVQGEYRRTAANPVVALPPAVASGAYPAVPVRTPGAPTGNTWAASHADIPKTSSAPLLIAAGVGVLLLAGGAFAAYEKFVGKSASKTVDSATAVTATSALPAPNPTQDTPSVAPVASAAPVVSPTPSTPSVASAEPVKAEPVAAAAKPAAAAAKAFAAKPAVAAAKPAAAKPAAAAPRPAAKPSKPTSRDFGY